MNVTLSELQVLSSNAILPLSAVSNHRLHSKIRRTAAIPSAATGHSGVHAKENAQTSTYSIAHCKTFFCGRSLNFIQQEVDSCASSPATAVTARLLTLLLNGSLG
jgi:hypothetical protein